jgi:ribonuclease BN (tRNA processing enzyme)
MQVTIVPASSSGEPLQPLTSYLVNGTLAVDAGCLGLYGTPEQQTRVRHVLISHAHLDHVASLPPFLDAVYDGSGDCVVVHGNAHVLDTLRKDVFNNRLVPDFLHISTFRPPYLRLNELRGGHPLDLAGLRVTPVDVDHAVPTLGFVIEDEESVAVFPSDTGPTDAIWDVVNRKGKPATVFLECTFPGSMGWLADVAKHLTPALFAAEMRKLRRAARYVAVHLHPRHRETVVAELEAMRLPYVEVGRFGVVYDV